jgi:pimeloyl-ACP methyl ester carboxylesterase
VERIVLVHGSVVNGPATWANQLGLADRYDLVVLDRPGFPPNPPVDRVDFEEHAQLVAAELGEGAHLAGHSSGGVVALLAAALRPGAVRSLTVVEPPATRVAAGDPAADRMARRAREWWENGPRDDPEAFLRGFLRSVGSTRDLPSPLTPELEQGARTLMVERGPWEADIPLATLREAPFPKLVVSGGHDAGFDAICDVLERELPAERVVLPGFGHSVPRHPRFTDVLVDFVERARAGTSGAGGRGGAGSGGTGTGASGAGASGAGASGAGASAAGASGAAGSGAAEGGGRGSGAPVKP